YLPTRRSSDLGRTEDGSVKDWCGSTVEVVVVVVPIHIEICVLDVGAVVACRIEERSAIDHPVARRELHRCAAFIIIDKAKRPPANRVIHYPIDVVQEP